MSNTSSRQAETAGVFNGFDTRRHRGMAGKDEQSHFVMAEKSNSSHHVVAASHGREPVDRDRSLDAQGPLDAVAITGTGWSSATGPAPVRGVGNDFRGRQGTTLRGRPMRIREASNKGRNDAAVSAALGNGFKYMTGGEFQTRVFIQKLEVPTTGDAGFSQPGSRSGPCAISGSR